MRTSAIIIGALSAAAYAKPVAQNGRWTPEWQNLNAEVSAGPSASAVPTPASSASVLGVPGASPNPTPNSKLVADLLTAPAGSDRITLLQDAEKNGIADFKARRSSIVVP